MVDEYLMINKYKSVDEVPVWKKSHELTLLVYKLTVKYPKYELYGLTSQIRRSSSSIPANISEGFNRNTTKELIQYLYNSRGSCGETLYHILLSKDLGYIDNEEYNILRDGFTNIIKQLNGWISSLRGKINH